MVKGDGGAKGVRRRGRKRRTPSEKQTVVLAPGRDKAMAPLRVHRNALDQAELSPRNHCRPQRPARSLIVGRYFVAGLAFSLRWWEFSIIPYMGLPTGVATAGANTFVMAIIVA